MTATVPSSYIVDSANAPWKRSVSEGVAFACQELPAIPREPWDVPLEALVTEREILAF